MTNTGTSGIQHQDKKFLAKFQNILIFFSTYRRYFKHFFLLVDKTSIGIECVIIFHRFSLMYAKYFTVYFRRTIKFDARVANLILYYSNVNALRNDNNVARVKSKRIETSICSIINIKLSKPIFGLPMRRNAKEWRRKEILKSWKVKRNTKVRFH